MIIIGCTVHYTGHADRLLWYSLAGPDGFHNGGFPVAKFIGPHETNFGSGAACSLMLYG